MAILHRAVLTPPKLQVVEQWLDQQPWGGSGPVEQVGSYRFDDPDGEVGVEAILVRRGSDILQATMTYRAAPLDGAEEHLIGTIDHSVLGQRWVYDAAYDPVAVGCFERALRGQQQQAELEVWDGGRVVEHRKQSVVLTLAKAGGDVAGSDDVAGSAIGVSVTAVGSSVRIARVLSGPVPGAANLIGRWGGGEASVASLR